MVRRNRNFLLALPALLLLIAGGLWLAFEHNKECCAYSEAAEPTGPKPKLGLMTSLPLYWPLGAEIHEIASGEVEVPWQRRIIEQRYEIVPLDTLSPIPALSPDQADLDPLAGLERIAVIQPRGLSPADNVALDEWVRAGGQLLLVLDPLLTGEYEVPLGDPRRPVDSAVIPPVVERWGMAVGFDADQSPDIVPVTFPRGVVFRSFAGQISVNEEANLHCEIFSEAMMAKCDVGAGSITLLADAATIEIPPREPSPVERQLPSQILNLLEFAFTR